MSDKKSWTCTIGEVDDADLMDGADTFMRNAVKLAYHDLTGEWPDFVFSGWNGELTDGERAFAQDLADARRDR